MKKLIFITTLLCLLSAIPCLSENNLPTLTISDFLAPYIRETDTQELMQAIKQEYGNFDEIKSISIIKVDLASALPFSSEATNDLFLLSVAKGEVPSQEDIQRTGVSYPFCGPGEDSPYNSREYRAHLLNGSSVSNGEALMMVYQIDRIISTPEETTSSNN